MKGAEMTATAEEVTGTKSEAAEAAPQAAAAKKHGQQTRMYIVLSVTAESSLDGGDETFKQVGIYTSSGDKAAIKAAKEEHGYGTYVAVAVSQWHRRTLAPKQVEQDVWS